MTKNAEKMITQSYASPSRPQLCAAGGRRRSTLRAQDVAEVFGLGQARAELRAVPGGHVHRMWRLDTDRGSYAVKEMNRQDNPEWMPWLQAAWRLELAAWGARIRMPEPVPPPSGGVVAEVPVEDAPPATVRVHRWVNGRSISQPIDGVVGNWAGRTLAALHSLAMPAEPRWAFPPTGTTEATRWQDLVDLSKDAGAEWAGDLSALAPVVEEIYDLTQIAATRWLPDLLTHADLRAKNVLVAATGPVLVDWDMAAAKVPREDLAGCALSVSGWNQDDGPVRETLRQVISGYRAAGGALERPLDVVDAAGDLGNEVDWVAAVARRAIGQGAQGPDDMERSAKLIPGLIRALPNKLLAARSLRWLLADQF